MSAVERRKEKSRTVKTFTPPPKFVVWGFFALIVVGVAYWLWRIYKKNTPEPEPEPQPKPKPPTPYVSGFDINDVLGKTGKLFVEGQGYIARYHEGSFKLEYHPNAGNGIEWVWQVVQGDNKVTPDTYQFEEAGSRAPDNKANYLSVNESGQGVMVTMPINRTSKSEHFRLETEAPGSRRFRLVPQRMQPASFITPTTLFTFT